MIPLIFVALFVGAEPPPGTPAPAPAAGSPAPAPATTPAPAAKTDVAHLVVTARVYPDPDPSAANDPAADPMAAEPTAAPVPVANTPNERPRPTEVKLATPLILEITATAPRDTVFFAPARPAIPPFFMIEPRPGFRKADGGTLVETWRWRILPVRMGIERVPAIEIPYRLADGTEGATKSPIVRVLIRGFLENEQNPSLAPPPPPVPILATNWALVWAISIVGTLLVAALLTWFVLKAMAARFAAMAPGPPPRPAIEVALMRLAQIDATPGSELNGADRLSAIIDTLREYLGSRYGIDALEMTTRELVAALDTVDLKTASLPAMASLLEHSDLVKFARLLPPEAEARAESPVVKAIVEATWEPPKPKEEIIPKLTPATLRQRLYAGAIDAILATGLGMIAFGGLWATGALELGWVALVVPGVVLVLRDLPSRSLGKRMLGLAIVARRERQPPATLRQRWLRNVALVLWPVFLPMETLLLRAHPLVLRLGDLLAETEVVQGGPTARRNAGGPPR